MSWQFFVTNLVFSPSLHNAWHRLQTCVEKHSHQDLAAVKIDHVQFYYKLLGFTKRTKFIVSPWEIYQDNKDMFIQYCMFNLGSVYNSNPYQHNAWLNIGKCLVYANFVRDSNSSFQQYQYSWCPARVNAVKWQSIHLKVRHEDSLRVMTLWTFFS